MLLRTKNARALFFATDPESKQTWEVDPRDYLLAWQERKMSTRPNMMLQFSHHIADKKRKEGYNQIQVRVGVMAWLNGRQPQFLIDPNVDLAAQSRTLPPGSCLW